MTGPPTPPITSAIEIEDAARAVSAAETPIETPVASSSEPPATAPEVVGSVPVEAVTLGTPEQAVAPFRKSFALLAELATQGKFQELVEDAEVADLNVCTLVLSMGRY